LSGEWRLAGFGLPRYSVKMEML